MGPHFSVDPVEVDAAEQDRLEALTDLANVAERMVEVRSGLADADLDSLPPELRAELDRMRQQDACAVTIPPMVGEPGLHTTRGMAIESGALPPLYVGGSQGQVNLRRNAPGGCFYNGHPQGTTEGVGR